MCDVLDMLVAVPLMIITAEMLDAAVDAFLEKCVAAKWEKHMHSKFHWTVHLSGELRRFKTLLACFVHERKHKVAKRYCTAVANTLSYEKSVLGEAIL